MPDGGYVIAECANNRLRRVTPDGTISTLAGSGPVSRGLLPKGGFSGDGGPATLARLNCPRSVSVGADGAIVFADFENRRVRRVTPDGRIDTIAGNGEFPEGPDAHSRATQAAIWPRSVSVAGDGSVLVADWWVARVWRVFADGTSGTAAGNGLQGRRDNDGQRAVFASVNPFAIDALPAGGFVVADEGSESAVGEEPRVRAIDPAGRIATPAGTGRFVLDPPAALERRGDGGPAGRADLLAVRDLAVLPDGGLVFSEGIEGLGGGTQSRIRYLAPAAPARLAAALRRDRDRMFAPGHGATVAVQLSAPATVALTLSRHGRRLAQLTQALPAGTSTVVIGRRLVSDVHEVGLVAIDGAGRIATDRAAVVPAGWLGEDLARYLAEGVLFAATHWDSVSGSGVLGCRRFGIARVDCRLSQEGRRCDRVVAVRLAPEARLRWGAYRCPARARPRWTRRPRPLVRREFVCSAEDTTCPRPVFGHLGPAMLRPPD